MTAKEFINGPLQQEIKKIAQIAPYHAFALESIAIEFLGKSLDINSPYDKNNNSRVDFVNAIKKLFPVRYHPFATLLYEEFRCGMLHFFGPKSGLDLIRKSEEKVHGKHLSVNRKGQLVLVIEDLHKDFISAADLLLKFKQSKNPKNKLNMEFLNT